MISDLDKLKKFNNLLSVHFQTKHTIVLNPKGKYNNRRRYTRKGYSIFN